MKKKIEIYFRFHVAFSITVADSMEYNKRERMRRFSCASFYYIFEYFF